MQTQFEVIIIGGSYSGLSAAMALGRALRNVLIIDSGKPCNRFTPHSHNFITHDGAIPASVSAKAKEQVAAYPTVQFVADIATDALKTTDGFTVITASGHTYTAKKLLIATGVIDTLPTIEGMAACWGKSVIHCPYCHGYEARNEKTAIVANGNAAYHYAVLLMQWTKGFNIFTNGTAYFEPEQLEKFSQHGIEVIETRIAEIQHNDGYLNNIVLQDGSSYNYTAIYTRPQNTQHCPIPEKLGCTINDMGYVVTDLLQKTNLYGVFSSGDCTTQLRSISNAVAQGTTAGAAINLELCTEDF